MPRKKLRRLTTKEWSLIEDAIGFALAGEWPWESGDDDKDDRDRAKLESALEKVRERL